MDALISAYSAESRQVVVDVAVKGEAPLAQIAKDFGLSVAPLIRGIALVERKESGTGPAASESPGMRELKKRNRSPEQEDEILRRAVTCLSRNITPHGSSTGPVRHEGPELTESGAAYAA